jgi:hypothetical protein
MNPDTRVAKIINSPESKIFPGVFMLSGDIFPKVKKIS